MGYLLKEALKTLCGVNQWSYAVFWKIGCQNPKLLIWEECYYEPASDYNASWVSAETRNLKSNFQTGDKVHLLVNKMMMDSHVNIVGEGLVGRVAFTGNHQWILSNNYFREAHPPEVLKEVCQQFSAGMQTVAVIPVLPHGVVQFGSFLTIMENMGFVNEVTSLILQLEYVSRGGSPLESNVVNAPHLFDNFNYVPNAGQTSMVNSRASFSLIQNELQSNGAPLNSTPSHHQPQHYPREPKIAPEMKLENLTSSSRLTNGVAKAEVIPSNSEIWMNQQASSSSSTLIHETTRRMEPKILSSTVNHGNFSNFKPLSGVDSVADAKLAANGNIKAQHLDSRNVIFSKTEAPTSEYNEHNVSMAELIFDDMYFQRESGDDLFDVLGADFKNKLFSTCWNSSRLSNQSAPNVHDNLPSKKNLAFSETYSTSQVNSESGIFSSTGTDNLLEAVVSKGHPLANQSTDDNVSCKTTLTSTSGSSAPNSTSLSYGRFGVSELFGAPKYLSKAGAMSSCSLKTGSSSMEESGTYSRGSSLYGSQISSWIEKDQKAKSNSASTGYSKKPDETGKTNRKRLKPGENPRPRPKDRQMIQDRVKELREIVPNGAKCSIDALLERTIKHMLFLQSVTKHADKLKQTGESKIISKDGGLLLKDNFEGGATWAYEVGSQSMVCPIIVEDLNQPRQMLVEMLCEERGLFLEIADIIRGLGLTILKGVMETRNDKIWARFAVEANRDVTRMEIFISLVRLLEQSTKNGASQPPNNRISSENVMAQQFHQVAPVPVTGGPRSLN